MPRPLPVICVDDNHVYESQTHAADKYGLQPHKLRYAIVNHLSYEGKRFVYCDQMGEYIANKDTWWHDVDKPKKSHASKPTLCIETNVTYPSQFAAAKAFGLSPSRLGKAIQEHATCDGFHFLRVSDAKSYNRDKDAWWQDESSKYQTILCFETNMRYESTLDAAHQLNMDATELTQSVNLRRPCQGLRFIKTSEMTQYAQDPSNWWQQDGQVNRKHKGRKWHSANPPKPVLRVNDNVIYKTAKEAAKALGLNGPSGIRKAIDTHTPYHGLRYIWLEDRVEYEKNPDDWWTPWYRIFATNVPSDENATSHQTPKNDDMPFIPPLIRPQAKPRPKRKRVRPVIVCVDTNARYEGFRAAAEANGMHVASLRMAIRENRRCKGLYFVMEKDLPLKTPPPPKPKPKAKTKPKRKRIPPIIVCVDTNVRYEGFRAAAEANGMHVTSLQMAIRENRRCKGLYFVMEKDLPLKTPPPPNLRNATVICIDTNTRYPNAETAAKAHNLSKSGVVTALREQRRCKGLLFVRERDLSQKAKAYEVEVARALQAGELPEEMTQDLIRAGFDYKAILARQETETQDNA